MAATLFGVSEYGSLSDKRIVCGGANPFVPKGAGYGSPKVLVCICANSKDQKMNGGAKKTVKINFDFVIKGLQSRRWLPLFGWSADGKWAEDGSSSESVEPSVLQNTRKITENENKSNEGQISVRRQSKFVAVSFTPEKAKLLRKTLRSTSSFHDLMYHSAIASRLASADISSKDCSPS
ncbi:hypothetical protein SUGI_0725500 [Cryptomeria japonica]|uniref:uncharacterized protein LOC131044143 n=1 Tax=Cryptomeria japonica TaxID=3369 RepID=UPI002414CBBB|nr:uncharacterized protein LOC131044143 [Cryptomeria japonica]GLJ36160.1 hypothetical protein SUGI_0725500 [Cryptomeria japonica]